MEYEIISSKVYVKSIIKVDIMGNFFNIEIVHDSENNITQEQIKNHLIDIIFKVEINPDNSITFWKKTFENSLFSPHVCMELDCFFFKNNPLLWYIIMREDVVMDRYIIKYFIEYIFENEDYYDKKYNVEEDK